MPNIILNGLNALGGYINTGYNKVSPYLFGDEKTKTQGFFPWLTTPIGEGEKAASPLQIGMSAYGLWQGNEQFEQQLEEARKQYAYQKALTGANFQNQATNWGNQALFQLQSLYDFNQQAGMNRASDLNASMTQLNKAGESIGINGVVSPQQNEIQKYNKITDYMSA